MCRCSSKCYASVTWGVKGIKKRFKMADDSNEKLLEKWEVLKGVGGKQIADIKFFHAFQTYTGDEKHRASSAIFLTTNDEAFGIGHNNEDNLLALTGDEFGEAVVLKNPRKIDGLSGKNVRKIVVSERFGAALTKDGRLIYWGTDMTSVQYELHAKKYVKLPHEPREDFKIVDMACGAHSITFVTDEKQVLLWGCINIYYSQFYSFEVVPLRKNVQVREMAAGWYHVALLDQNGQVWTFGYGSVGQLGHSREGINYTTPKKVYLPRPCKKVECGAYSTLFLLNNGELYACGSNSQSDHLCVGKTGYVITPAKVLLDDNIEDIAATYAWSSGGWQSLFSAASKDHVKYFKWGNDRKLDNPITADGAHSLLDVFANFKTPQSLGKLVRDDVIVLSDRIGPENTFADPLPNKSILERWLIFDVLDDDFIKKIKSFTVYYGTDFIKQILGAFIITTDDEVYSWGYNGNVTGSLGLGSDEKATEAPAKVGNLSGKKITKILVSITVGGIALSKNGLLYVWYDKSLPQVEQNLIGKTVVDVACGYIFYVYYLANSELYLVNLNGTQSTNFSKVRHMKISVPGKEKVVTLASGARHFLVLTDESNVYAYGFGRGHYGTLGDEWEEYDESPIRRLKINSPGPCKKIMGGVNSSFFLTDTGELYKFGITYYLDWPGFEQTRVVHKPERLFVNEQIEDIAGSYVAGVFALKTTSGKICKWKESDTELDELKEAKFLVEAFEEEEIPQSLSLVRLSSLKSELNDDNDTGSTLTGIYAPAISVGNNLFSDPLYSDVTIILKDGVVPGHKVLLHTKSAFFRNALSSNEIVNRDELDLLSYNPSAVRALLKNIYGLPIGQRASSLKDRLDFHKLALEDGNPDLIDEAEKIMLKNMIFDKQNEYLGAAPSGEDIRKEIQDFMNSTVFP